MQKVWKKRKHEKVNPATGRPLPKMERSVAWKRLSQAIGRGGK
jgi:hypothetical protein